MLHPDEGTIHAWLDGELLEDQANEIAAHAGDCPECSARVAEARGLIAASTRILTALDNVPAGVIPELADTLPASAPARRRHWYDRTDIRAAAILVVAGASYLVMRDSGASRGTLVVADKIQASPMPVAENAPIAPPVAEQRAEQPSAQIPTPVAAHKASGPLAKSRITGGVARTESTQRLDAVGATSADAATRVTEPTTMMLMPRPASASVIVTSKRGKPRDSATFSVSGSASGVAAGAASGVERASGIVEGRVVDKKNDHGIAGASVILPGASLSTSTDKDGRFSIANVPAGEQHLIVRHIGYEAQNIALTVARESSVTTNLAMEPQVLSLSQVVVTGSGSATSLPGGPLREINVDSTTATRRTVYEISPGVRVTLADSPVGTWQVEGAIGGQLQGRVAGVPQRSANASDEKASINRIAWTDGGHHYELSGPVSAETLQALRRRLMELKR